jgi:hypothetical protein
LEKKSKALSNYNILIINVLYKKLKNLIIYTIKLKTPPFGVGGLKAPLLRRGWGRLLWKPY